MCCLVTANVEDEEVKKKKGSGKQEAGSLRHVLQEGDAFVRSCSINKKKKGSG